MIRSILKVAIAIAWLILLIHVRYSLVLCQKKMVGPGLSHLSPEKRALIVGYRLSGKTVRDTALRFQVSKRTVSKLVKKFRDTDSVANLPRSGRPRKTTAAQDNELRRMVRGNRKMTGAVF